MDREERSGKVSESLTRLDLDRRDATKEETRRSTHTRAFETIPPPPAVSVQVVAYWVSVG